MNTHWKHPGSLFVVLFLTLSLFGVANAQSGDADGTISISVVACGSLTNHGVLDSVPADCETAGGLFTFYLRGDGTNDFDQLLIPETFGEGEIFLAPGTYEVVEENTQTHFDVTVTSGTTSSVIFGFASGIQPEPEPQPVRLYVTSLVCENYEAASFINFDGVVPDECSRVGGDVFSLYLYGDGTDDYVQVTTVNNGAAYIDLMPGRYEMVHEGTQMSSEIVLNEGSDLSIAFTLPAPVDNGPPTKTPVPTKVAPTVAPVKALPNTGAGSESGVTMLLISVAAGTMLVAGAGLVRSKSA